MCLFNGWLISSELSLSGIELPIKIILQFPRQDPIHWPILLLSLCYINQTWFNGTKVTSPIWKGIEIDTFWLIKVHLQRQKLLSQWCFHYRCCYVTLCMSGRWGFGFCHLNQPGVLSADVSAHPITRSSLILVVKTIMSLSTKRRDIN